LNEITRDHIKQFVAHLMKKEHSHIVEVKTRDAEGKTVVERKTVTAPLLTPEEMDAAAKKQISYRGPGGQ